MTGVTSLTKSSSIVSAAPAGLDRKCRTTRLIPVLAHWATFFRRIRGFASAPNMSNQVFQLDACAARECTEGFSAGRRKGYRAAHAVAMAALLVALSSALPGAPALYAQTVGPNDSSPAASSAAGDHAQ